MISIKEVNFVKLIVLIFTNDEEISSYIEHYLTCFAWSFNIIFKFVISNITCIILCGGGDLSFGMGLE